VAGAPDGGEHIGKICPYCRFPIMRGDRVTVCTVCGIPHHQSCWYENGRCTTYGCKGVADRLAAVLPPEYRSRHDVPGFGRPQGRPADPVAWMILSLALLSPAFLLASLLFRHGWLLAAGVCVTMLIAATAYKRYAEREELALRDRVLYLAFIALGVVAVAFIVFTVMYGG